MNIVAIAGVTLLCSVTLCGQVLMGGLAPGGERWLFPSDAAVLDLHESRTSLRCAVKPVRAELDYTLGFQTGYQVRIRLHDFAGHGDVLTVVFRVTSDRGLTPPVYFQQKWEVPPVPEDADGETTLDGTLTVGEGDYHLAWLMRDRNERVCSAYWKISAHLPAGKGPFSMALSPGVVLPSTGDYAWMKQPSSGSADKQLTVSVFLHVESQFAGFATLAPEDRYALSSMVRSIAREPRISSLSVTAFNLARSQVVFRQDDIRQIDLAALDTAINSLNLGTITVQLLAAKDTGARFLVELVGDQVARSHADALIFLGPKIMDDRALPDELFRQLNDTVCPVFYLSYNPAWNVRAGADLIGSVVRHWRGSEFSINKPLDLLSAWSKIMSRISDGTPWRNASTAH